MALFRSRHLVDVAGRNPVAFLRTLLKDKLREFVGHRLVFLQPAHERQRHEGLAAVFAFYARDPWQFDEAKARVRILCTVFAIMGDFVYESGVFAKTSPF